MEETILLCLTKQLLIDVFKAWCEWGISLHLTLSSERSYAHDYNNS